MYPRNAASPERIAVGPVVQISDGAVQTSGVSIAVRGQGGASGAGGGATAYDNGIVEYTPTQGETDFTSFVVIAYKTGCIPVSQTIVTSAASTAGHAYVGGMAASVITATAIAADAITAAKVASDVTTELQSGLATAADLATLTGYIDTEVAAIKAKTDNLPADPADASDIAASFTTVNSTLATIASYIDTEVAAIKAKTDNLPAAPAAVGDIPSASAVAAAVLTTALTEAYAANGVAPTLTQAMLAVHQVLMDFAIAGTAYTVRKLDGATTAFVITLDDATTPTEATRS